MSGPYWFLYIYKASYEKHNVLRKCEDESQPLIRSIKAALTGPPL